MSEINYSYAVLSVFLLLFGVFMLFHDPSITGLASLNLEKNRFIQNEYLDGKFTVSLENDFINENAVIEIKLEKGGSTIISRSMSFTEFLSHSGATLEKVTNPSGETGYESNADFIIDLSWFSIIVSESGNYKLIITLKHNATTYTTKEFTPITIDSRLGAGLPEIVDIAFGKLDKDNLLESDINEFSKGDKVGCGIVYNGDVTEIKVYIFAPGDSKDSPTYTLTNSTSTTLVFSSSHGTAMLMMQEINVNKPGQWSCAAELTNARGSTKGVSSNSLMQLSSGSSEKCTEDWECTNWAPCDNGIQIRSCSDNNECGTKKKIPTIQQQCGSTPPPPKTKEPSPPPSQQDKTSVTTPPSAKPKTPPVKKSSSSTRNYLIPIIVLVVIAGIIITTLIIIKRKKAKEIIKEEEIEKPKTEVMQPKIKKPLTEIESFILKSLESGTNKEILQKQLLGVGWKPDQIKKELNKMGLYKFVESNLKKGITKEVLLPQLINKGWPKELIDEVMSKL